MGRVQGETKLRTPATKARKKRTRRLTSGTSGAKPFSRAAFRPPRTSISLS